MKLNDLFENNTFDTVPWIIVGAMPSMEDPKLKQLCQRTLERFTTTNIMDVQCLINFEGVNGPSKSSDVLNIRKFLKDNCDNKTIVSNVLKGMITVGDMEYEPKAIIYAMPLDTFLVVKDDFGVYVYTWPTEDTKDPYDHGLKAQINREKTAFGKEQ